MKYVANPVEVDAFRIVAIEAVADCLGKERFGGFTTGLVLELETGLRMRATPEMTARMTPVVGDYWVIQSDGYAYINPKDVFERKYHRADGLTVIDENGKVSGSPENIEFLKSLPTLRRK